METTKKITRIQAEYEFQQDKDSIQSASEKQQISFEQEIETRKVTQTATFIGLGLLGALVFVLFLFFQSKHKDNRLLKEQSSELQASNEETKTINEKLIKANKEIRFRNEELHTLNEAINQSYNTIQHQQSKILSSLQYAQRIQDAILPNWEQAKKLAIPESFVFYQPKDVVSGDFYWVGNLLEEENKFILAAIDCTGHGVPGAFMSMIGNELLNYIIINQQISSPDIILTQLHLEVRRALKQQETHTQDGMDMALVVIDFTNKTIEFAGAKNPLAYIQKDELKVIKGDKKPIGGEQREAERIFTKHTLSFAENPITFYLFSDGYQDQFGGPKGKKFMMKKLRELFLEIHTKPMNEQLQLLTSSFESWKGNEDQVDDVLVMGVRVGIDKIN